MTSETNCVLRHMMLESEGTWWSSCTKTEPERFNGLCNSRRAIVVEVAEEQTIRFGKGGSVCFGQCFKVQI